MEKNTSFLKRSQLMVKVAEITTEIVQKKFEKMTLQKLELEGNLPIFFNLGQLLFLSPVEEKNLKEASVVEQKIGCLFDKLGVFFKKSELVPDLEFIVFKENFGEKGQKRARFSQLFSKFSRMFSLHSSMLGFIMDIRDGKGFTSFLRKDNDIFAGLLKDLDLLYKCSLFGPRHDEQGKGLNKIYRSLSEVLPSIHTKFFEIKSMLYLNEEDLDLE